MRHFLALILLTCCVATMHAQTNIYNPDADGSGVITLGDLLSFLSVYGTEFDGSPCNCGCYANPSYEPFVSGDTLTTYEVASNIFYSQPDSIRMDFVIAPFGTGSMPFSDVDTIYYDTLAFQQTYPFDRIDLDGYYQTGYGNSVPFIYYRNESSYYSITSGEVRGGIDFYDGSSSSIRLEAKSLCPNLENDEYWTIYNSAQFFQVESGVYVNVFEFASPNVPTQASDEFPTTWTLRYPLNWIVITEIHND